MSKEKNIGIPKWVKGSLSDSFQQEGKELVYIVPVKKTALGRFFGAVNQNGIEVFEATNKKELNKVDELFFQDWESSSVEHFFIKAQFIFQKDLFSKELIVEDKGKEIEAIIRQHIPVQVMQRPWWRKIIGFRSKTKWKMVVASIFYFVLITNILGSFVDSKDIKQAAQPVETMAQPEQVVQPAETIVQPEQKQASDIKEEPKPVGKINVTLNISPNINDGKVIFKGDTNLPEGTELLVTLQNKDKYKGQANATVTNGTFETEEFSQQDKALPSGKYNVEIVMPIASVQPDSVKEIIGENSSNLEGNLVKNEKLGKIVRATKDFEITKNQTTNNSKSDKQKETQQLKQHEKFLKDTFDSITREAAKHKNSYDVYSWSSFARSTRDKISNDRAIFEESFIPLPGKVSGDNMGSALSISELYVKLHAGYITEVWKDLEHDPNELQKTKKEIQQLFKEINIK